MKTADRLALDQRDEWRTWFKWQDHGGVSTWLVPLEPTERLCPARGQAYMVLQLTRGRCFYFCIELHRHHLPFAATRQHRHTLLSRHTFLASSTFINFVINLLRFRIFLTWPLLRTSLIWSAYFSRAPSTYLP